MNDFQNIKKLIIPLIKGSPFILFCCAVGLFLAQDRLERSTPIFESKALIKLDDIDYGTSSSTLYEDFDLFTNSNKIMAEVEILKSKMLIQKALRKLDFNVLYYQKDKRLQEIYLRSPFLVEYEIKNPRFYDRRFTIKVLSDDEFELSYSLRGQKETLKSKLNTTISTKNFQIRIVKNRKRFDQPKLPFEGEYYFHIMSYSQLADKLTDNDMMNVKSLDKDIAVLRVSLKNEIPEKTSLFVNALSDTYIDDFIENRSGAAGKTVDFIDHQLDVITHKLKNVENEIENYRTDKNIINTRQETETDLRRISQLRIQLTNLEMNEAALNELFEYINRGDSNFMELAPNFEAFNDLLSTELVKKLHLLQGERKKMLVKYTQEHQKVKNIDQQIQDITRYLKESIKNTRNNIITKRKQIAEAVRDSEKVFVGLPSKERKLLQLERDFKIYQRTYTFLTEKRTEAAIQEAATISFHRIIERAQTPRMPVSPNRNLVRIVSVFVALILSIVVIYIYVFVGGKIQTRKDLERIVERPIDGVVIKYRRRGRNRKTENFRSLATNLSLLNQFKDHQIIQFTSSISKEGTTFLISNLAQAFAQIGKKVLLIDLNFRNPDLHNQFNAENNIGFSEVLIGKAKFEDAILQIQENLFLIPAGETLDEPFLLINQPNFATYLEKAKDQYDMVLVDTPGTAMAMEALFVMRLCDFIFYVVRANYTKSQFLSNADLIAEEYNMDHIHMILNGVHMATNYNGNYVGSRLNYVARDKRRGRKFLHYLTTYFR